MPRFALPVVCALALAGARVLSQAPVAAQVAGELGEDEKIVGLSRVWMEARMNFPRFAELPHLDWDASYAAFLPRARAALTTYDYYNVLRAFAAQLHSGHTNVFLPPELDRMEVEPPLRLDLIEDRVLVTGVDSPSLVAAGLTPGLELMAVDGEDVHARANRRRPFVASDSPQHLNVQLYSHGLLAGPRDTTVELTLRDAGGRTLRQSVRRSAYPDARPPAAFTHRDLPGNVAVIALDTFDADVMAAFDADISRLRRASGVIIDLRRNEGGSGQVAFNILGAFMDEDFETTRWKSRRYVPTLRAWGQKDVWFEPEPTRWHARPEPIRVPVALLTGPRSISATDVFAETFQRLHRGAVIGEPTGGSIGDPITVRLPGGGYFRVATSTAALVGHGIVPDIAVARTVRDVQANDDKAMTRARSALAFHESP